MKYFLPFCWSGNSAGFDGAVVLLHRGQLGSLTQSYSAGCWGGLEGQRLHSHLCCLSALQHSFFLQMVFFVLGANLSYLAAWQLTFPKRAKLDLQDYIKHSLRSYPRPHVPHSVSQSKFQDKYRFRYRKLDSTFC